MFPAMAKFLDFWALLTAYSFKASHDWHDPVQAVTEAVLADCDTVWPTEAIMF